MQSNYTLPTMEWMLDRIDVRGPDECWPWKLSLDRYGYGHCRNRAASRVMYEVVHGEIGDKRAVVMHSCDNPACCNPSHLSIGTHRKNMRDAGERGRYPAILGDESAAEVKFLLAMECRPGDIAKMYGVEDLAVSRIRDGLTYRDVPWPEGYVPPIA